MASVKQVVDATSDAGRAAASAIIGIGDGIAGGVVGGVSGAVYGAAEGLGLRRPTAPTAVLAMAAVGAGILGLVDWPLLALAGGAALVASQLRVRPQGSFISAAPTPASTRRPRKNAATTSTPTPPAKTAPGKPATVKRATVRKAAAKKTAAKANGRVLRRDQRTVKRRLAPGPPVLLLSGISSSPATPTSRTTYARCSSPTDGTPPMGTPSSSAASSLGISHARTARCRSAGSSGGP